MTRQPKPRLGALLGAAAAASLFLVLAVTLSGLDARTGLGSLGDVLMSLGLFIAATTLLAAILLGAVRLFSGRPGAFVIVLGSGGAAAYLLVSGRTAMWPEAAAFTLAVVLVLWVGWAVGSLVHEVLLGRQPPRGSRVRRRTVVNVLLSGVVLVLVPAGLWSLHARGAPTTTHLPAERNSLLAGLPNPAAQGSHQVSQFRYGSGPDARGQVYGDEADFPSPTLDLRPLLPDFRGLQARLHASYWGFGLDEVPLNARIHMPEDPAGPVPVVVLIHGVEMDSNYSEEGFDYLARSLASRGSAVVSVDMNFLDYPHIADQAAEMPVRAWLALEHLRFLSEWQEAGLDPWTQHLDLDRIVLVGHSRGGETAALAAILSRLQRYPPNAAIPLSFGFGIRGVVALAPTDQFWRPGDEASRLEDVSYLVVHGSHDADLSSFMGAAQWQRVRIPRGSESFKASVYVAGANHSAFTRTGRLRDLRGLMGLLLNQEGLMPAGRQQELTQTLVSAFVEVTVKDRWEYRPIFSDPLSGLPWLPPTEYVTRFEDGFTETVATFEEDVDPSSATLEGATIEGRNFQVWREERLRLRNDRQPSQETRVVRLQWNHTGPATSLPVWEIQLPDPLPEGLVDGDSRLRFGLGHQASALGVPDFSVELQDTSGQTARLRVGAWAPRSPQDFPQLWRWRFLDAFLTGPAEEVLQDYEIPLAAFLEANPELDPESVGWIRLVFDQTPAGTILLDDVSFRRLPGPWPDPGR
ncbi:MAG: hypothetical protein EA352_03910 [Gemmatimonadales bacterium]|nr:MAG: hypothetical protein EA352_03910 [Gemmatimonadales bacterium]